MRTAIFLLSHFDDELGVFNLIKHHKSQGHRLVLLYLTSSNKYHHFSPKRQEASLKVFKLLGLERKDKIVYVGSKLKILDLQLHLNFEKCYEACLKIVAEESNLFKVYTHSFEGGHPDHDASFIITSMIVRQLGINDIAFQFPMYSGKNLPGSFFRFFYPMKENGKFSRQKISFLNSILFTKLFFSYFRQQPKTIVGLSVPFLIHTLFYRNQVTQRIQRHRLLERPHIGTLLYERRRMCSYEAFEQKANAFLKKIINSTD